MAQAVRVLRPGGALLVYGSPERLWMRHLKIIAAEWHFRPRLQAAHLVGVQAGRRLQDARDVQVRGAHGAPGVVRQAWGGACVQRRGWDGAVHRGGEGGGARQGRWPRDVRVPRQAVAPRATGGTSRARTPLQGARLRHAPVDEALKLCDRIVGIHSDAESTILVPFGGSGPSACPPRSLVAASSLTRKRSNTTSSSSAACGAGS